MLQYILTILGLTPQLGPRVSALEQWKLDHAYEVGDVKELRDKVAQLDGDVQKATDTANENLNTILGAMRSSEEALKDHMDAKFGPLASKVGALELRVARLEGE